MLLLIFAAISLLAAVGAGLNGGIVAAVITLFATFLGLLVLAVLFLVVICAFVDREKPQEKDSKFFRTVIRLYIDMLVVLCRVKIRAEGMEQIPQQGRFLLVCNHLSNLDPVLLMKYFGNKDIVFISKRENQTMPFVGAVMHKLRCPLINRENDREALKTIIRSIQLIRDDEASIGLFPEGYVSLDGRLRQFRSGAFKIAQKTGVPIVVCTVRNTAQALSRLVRLRSSEVAVHLVEVIPAQELAEMSTQEIANRVYESMISDLGEERRCEEKGMRPDLQRQQMQEQEKES